MRLSIVIPVYNEEKCLDRNIRLVYKEAKTITSDFEILIIDDSSNDNTLSVARKLEKEFNEIRVVHYSNGPTRRENMAKSFRMTKGEVIAYLDADLSVNPQALNEIIAPIKNGYDIVIGSRYIKGATAKRKLVRRSISFLYNLFIRIIFSSKIYDHQCGFKALTRKSALDIISDMGYDKNLTRGWFWDAELLIRAQKKKYKILEIPVVWHYGGKSTFSISRELKMLPYVLSLKNKLK